MNALENQRLLDRKIADAVTALELALAEARKAPPSEYARAFGMLEVRVENVIAGLRHG